MKTIPIHVTLPQSFIDQMNLTPFDLAEKLSVIYGNKQVSYQVDVVSDDYFDQFHG